MSRFILRDQFVIDVVPVYYFGIEKDFAIYFPGESLVNFQCQKNLKLVDSTDLFIHYNTIQKHSRLVITEPNLSKNKDFLHQSLENFHSTYPLPETKEILIGVSFYPENILGELNASLSGLITFYSNPRFSLEKIIIACTHRQSKSFNQIASDLCKGNSEIFSIANNSMFDLYDKIMCRVCKELPFVAYVSKCCNLMYCEKCKNTTLTCFDCSIENIQYIEEPFLNSFFRDFKFSCRCHSEVNFDKAREHLFNCELTIYACQRAGCEYNGTQAELVAHVVKRHFDDVLSKVSGPNTYIGQKTNKECPNCNAFAADEVCDNCQFAFPSFPEILNKLQIE